MLLSAKFCHRCFASILIIIIKIPEHLVLSHAIDLLTRAVFRQLDGTYTPRKTCRSVSARTSRSSNGHKQTGKQPPQAVESVATLGRGPAAAAPCQPV